MIKKWLFLLPLMAIVMLFAITPKIEASTLNYSITYLDNKGTINPSTNLPYDDSNRASTDFIEIINGDIILSSNLFHNIEYFDSNYNLLAMHKSNSSRMGYGTQPIINGLTVTNYPSGAVYFRLIARKVSYSDAAGFFTAISLSELQSFTVSYNNPEPVFQTETAIFNYNMGNAEIVVTSPEPTFDSANITSRGILIGRSDTGTTSASQLTVNEGGGVYPKTGAITGSQVITFTNIQPSVTYYFRSYVVYNNSNFYYSDGIELTTSNFNERTIDYINWNGEVIYTTELPVGSDITQRDLTAQNFITGREGYRFLGWSGDTTVTDEFRVFERTAQWEQVITYDVTFTDYDDSIIEVVTVEQGQTAIPTQTPTRTGYIFAYWEPPVTDIQGNLTTKAIYYVVITWRGLNDELIRIDNVLENEPLSPPARAGYVRVWNSPATATIPATYTLQSETIEQNSGVTESGVTESGTTIIYRTQLPDNYSGITDLFGGVFGAIVGTIMILGTIDLFGVELSSLFWLFFAGSGFFMIWRFVR